jgi:hypothetical protein
VGVDDVSGAAGDDQQLRVVERDLAGGTPAVRARLDAADLDHLEPRVGHQPTASRTV